MKENNQNTLTTGNRFLMDMPTAWFMILSLIIVGAGFLGKLPTSMVGGFALFMSLGYLIRFIYWKVPLIKNTLGLASIGLTCAIIKHFGLWPENIVETMTNFIQGHGFSLLVYRRSDHRQYPWDEPGVADQGGHPLLRTDHWRSDFRLSAGWPGGTGIWNVL